MGSPFQIFLKLFPESDFELIRKKFAVQLLSHGLTPPSLFLGGRSPLNT
jgi:hypothetical protein